MAAQGYLRFPTIFQDRIVFVAEDDLWLVASTGGRAERLTAGVAEVRYPRISPDGSWVAFVGREEGPSEVFIMPMLGGPAQRLTYQAGRCRVLGWSADGAEIFYASNAGQFARSFDVIYAVKPQGELPRQLTQWGMASTLALGPGGEVVLGRHNQRRDYAHWKRYRGGQVGHLWCDATGSGTFQRLLHLAGNVTDPCWAGERLYFLADHEGIGNLYSCTPSGEDVRRHTHHTDFYARHLSSDGQRLVYHAGADLYLYDPEIKHSRRLDLELPSLRTQRQRKFVSASRYLDTLALHPQGHRLALTTRGKALSLGHWEGPVMQYGEPDGVRYRFLEWLNDGQRLLAICDAPGYEALVLFHPETASTTLLAELDLGRVNHLTVAPTQDMVAVTNHRQELLVVDLETRTARVVDQSAYRALGDPCWSPDGRWLAYSFFLSHEQAALKVCQVERGETYQVTDPVLRDISPSFDPEGNYLYFIGYRHFTPVYDSLQFDLGFPRGGKPYVVLLRHDQKSPFVPEPKALGDPVKEGATPSTQVDTESNAQARQAHDVLSGQVTPMVIDLDGIRRRVLPFPVDEGRYSTIRGMKGKALFLSFPLEKSDEQQRGGHIDCYDFERHKKECLIEGVTSFELSRDGRTLLYRQGSRLRVLKAGEKPPKGNHGDHPGRESGWLDLHRVKVSVQPASEWRQMFAEAWRLQREHFWDENMMGVDWEAMYARYAPLLERVSSRSELSDLLWELQGELGTSHAYEHGGDYRAGPNYRQGFLGVDWSYDATDQRYRLTRIIQGDPAECTATSPLTGPGLDVAEGDAVLAINGQRVRSARPPQALLVNQAGQEVQLTIEDAQTKQAHVISVKALRSEFPARYRDWVEGNRRLVHETSDNQVGYLHIPNMYGPGYAEFHRSFLREYNYPALIVDVRWNTGGRVSGLLLQKLARRRLGYKLSRWRAPLPFPYESPRGPLVALTNEQAGSDGDIFSHSFKLLGLGPLIGMRTWGGVIGIAPRHTLVDGTVTTQPEFFSWFKDVGWQVENYGTDPDIEVDIAPQDFAQHRDPQLERAIAEALRLVEMSATLDVPSSGDRPTHGKRE
ncbi:MAG: PDZ domain-containing protein [Ktedonobacteraceae bacterium]|nr:PDZ domain-containing protein [Ktedonobacteraceae bacterium]